MKELRALESTRLSGGGYRISAPRGQHDDYVTVLALLANRIKRSVSREPWVEFLSLDAPGARPGVTLDPRDDGPARWWHKV